MQQAIQLWKELEGTNNLYPNWVDKEAGIRTIRFSNTVARELAILITQNIDIKTAPLYGSADKANFIQQAIDKSFLINAQENIEKMIRLGGIMAKWNGEGIDYITPDMFLVTDFDSNGTINGCIFFSFYNEKEKYYTRAEWQRFNKVTRKNEETGETEDIKVYKISNKAFVSSNKDEIGREIPLSKTKWSDIQEEVSIDGLGYPLFSYIKNTYSNTIDSDSPLGVSLFEECIEELRALDIAFSRFSDETEDSRHIMFVDNSTITYAENNNIKLPRIIKGLDMGVNVENTVHEFNPTMQVVEREDGINLLLSIISYKCGFSAGYFSFNEKTGIATATQVESDDRRTLNTVNAYRNVLSRPDCNGDGRVGVIHDIAYMIDTMVTMNGEFPPTEYGNYEIYADFADLTDNPQEDKAEDYQLTLQGFYPKWYYLVQHKGFTEEDAKAMVEMARSDNQTDSSLFGDE